MKLVVFLIRGNIQNQFLPLDVQLLHHLVRNRIGVGQLEKMHESTHATLCSFFPSQSGRHPAGHHDVLAGDVGGVGRAKERGQTGNVLGGAESEEK